MDLHSSFTGLLSGIGCAGLFISLPAGMIADRYSTSLAAACGAVLLVVGYIAFSFANSKMSLVLAWICVGVGSGSTFQVCVACRATPA
jgi:MFS family permease